MINLYYSGRIAPKKKNNGSYSAKEKPIIINKNLKKGEKT